MINKLKEIIKPLLVRWIILKSCLHDYRYLSKNICTYKTYKNPQKLKASLLLQVHIIEKGLSLKNVRPGFGIPKIQRLLRDLNEYKRLYHDDELLLYVLSVVKEYIKFNETQGQATDEQILASYAIMSAAIPSEEWETYKDMLGGVTFVTQEDINGEDFPFATFARSRHSIRSFTGEPVKQSAIEEALRIAETTPSACNRQPWENYVFTKRENIVRILDLQSGARQFKEDVGAVIIVTSSANSFSITEYHQPYVNGGLYAMNLLYALHSLGLGTIPLNLGVNQSQLSKIKDAAQIPESQIPIMLIAVGHVCEALKVTCSKRFPFNEYTIFD